MKKINVFIAASVIILVIFVFRAALYRPYNDGNMKEEAVILQTSMGTLIYVSVIVDH